MDETHYKQGELFVRRGRPRRYENNAERQRAYRERLRANGRRVITKTILDVRGNTALHSDVIDLSEVRR
jgi:hypothetical protein